MKGKKQGEIPKLYIKQPHYTKLEFFFQLLPNFMRNGFQYLLGHITK